MKYYQKIKIDDLEIIQQKVLEFVKQQPAIYYHWRETSFNHLNVLSLIEHCPELQQSFDKLNLKIVFAAVHCMWFQEQASIHIDRVPWKARINVPILNTKNSFTVFFKNVEFVEKTYKMENGDEYSTYVITNDNYQEADRVEIDQPTVIRVQEAHTVIMNKFKAPRINLSLGFDRDPIFMLEDSTELPDL